MNDRPSYRWLDQQGEAFGAPGYLRLSYATSIERIDEGLRRLERFFSRAEAAS